MFEKVGKIIAFRGRQIQRVLQDIGLVLGLVLLFVSVIFILNILEKLSTTDIKIIISTWTFIILLLHNIRHDYNFIKLSFPNFKVIIFIEYLILSLPIFLILTLFKKWEIIYVIPLLLLIAFLPQKRYVLQSIPDIPLSFIGKSKFVTRYILRKQLIVHVFMVLIGSASAIYLYPVSLLIIIIIALLFGEANQFFEGFVLIKSQETNDYIKEKIKEQVKLYLGFILPIFLLFLWFNFEKWWLLLYFIYTGFSFVVYVILLKYTFYRADRLKYFNSVPLIIFGFLNIIPFLNIIALYLLLNHWKKAHQNLLKYG